tara:strand:- start:231 stop:380 length:150 start_codon:yes stop_codon:yes gene_type:complete
MVYLKSLESNQLITAIGSLKLMSKICVEVADKKEKLFFKTIFISLFSIN